MDKTTTYHRIVAYGAGLLVIANLLPLLLFVVQPKLFYYRAAEYFNDFVFKGAAYETFWEGPETGDQSRHNLFFYQEAKFNRVFVDADGIRPAPIKAERYPIVVTGDSTIWGGGVSDEETLPSRLAVRLQKPVFNGSAAPIRIRNVLKHPALADVRTIIECRTERFTIGHRLHSLVSPHDYSPPRRRPQRHRAVNTINALIDAPMKRYALFSLMSNMVVRFRNDLTLYYHGGRQKPYLFVPHAMKPEDLESAVAGVISHSEHFKALGKRYIFVSIPAKQSVVDPPHDVDPFTRDYLLQLTPRLVEAGVETIDLLTPFRERRDDVLFQRYDTHWNEKGIDLAAQVISHYLTTGESSLPQDPASRPAGRVPQ